MDSIEQLRYDELNKLPYHSKKCFCKDCRIRESLELSIIEDMNEGF